MPKPRYAIESWFFGALGLPAGLRAAGRVSTATGHAPVVIEARGLHKTFRIPSTRGSLEGACHASVQARRLPRAARTA